MRAFHEAVSDEVEGVEVEDAELLLFSLSVLLLVCPLSVPEGER
jgi:hypothetical protein